MSAIAISSPFSTARTTYTLPSLQGRGRTLGSLQISHHTKLHTRLSFTLTGTYITRSRFRNNNKNIITNAYAEESNGINYSVEKSADDFSSKEVESNSVLNSSQGKEVVVENKEKNNAAADSTVEGKSSGAMDNLAGIFAVSWSKMAELFKLNGFWKWWPSWQREKRLQYLAAQADANPADSAKQSALLSELNKHSPEDVIKRFEQKEYATDSQAVAEYLRALVVTTTLSEYLPDEHSGRPSFLPALFGAVDIDGSLVVSQTSGAEDIVMLNNGCICCTVRGDLVNMLRQLFKTRGGKFDHILKKQQG